VARGRVDRQRPVLHDQPVGIAPGRGPRPRGIEPQGALPPARGDHSAPGRATPPPYFGHCDALVDDGGFSLGL
jgi:hypothetical protein